MIVLSVMLMATLAGTSAPTCNKRKSSALATSCEAPPPKPFRTATISGIDVMATLRAMIAPMPPPRTTPTRM